MQMRALRIARPGDPSVLSVEEVTRPTPTAREILVRVTAAALNRADLLQRAGRYPAPPGVPPDIPGLEFAGTVAELGSQTSRWRVGDRIFGLVAGGAQAEYLVTHEETVAAIPANIGMIEAAAVPEAFITAHDALISQAEMKAGNRVLIFAVGSGVGLAAVHLIRAFGAASWGTTRTPDKLLRARAEGLCDGAVVELPGEIPPLVERWTGGAGMDVVLDLVGGDYAAAGVDSLAPRGRLMCIGTIAGTRASLDLRRILSRRLTIRGTVLRARTLDEKIAVTSAFVRDVVPLLAAGSVSPVVDGVYPLEAAGDAHTRLERGDAVGKLVLAIAHDDA
jgi:putative PIG3 family NAD(P)H quinone oxidoreductase